MATRIKRCAFDTRVNLLKWYKQLFIMRYVWNYCISCQRSTTKFFYFFIDLWYLAVLMVCGTTEMQLIQTIIETLGGEEYHFLSLQFVIGLLDIIIIINYNS